MLFHPVYLITNAKTCSTLGTNYLAGFGLGSLTLGIMAISIGAGYSNGLATLVSQAFGAKKLDLCRTYLYRQYFLNTIVFFILTIPIIFIRQIYDLIG